MGQGAIITLTSSSWLSGILRACLKHQVEKAHNIRQRQLGETSAGTLLVALFRCIKCVLAVQRCRIWGSQTMVKKVSCQPFVPTKTPVADQPYLST
jgi:hypothetical protein